MRKPITIGLALTLVILVGLGLRALLAQQTTRDGVWKPIPSAEGLGMWSAIPATSPGQDGQPLTQVRVVERTDGRTLGELARPGETRLEVVDRSFPPFAVGAEDPTIELTAHTRRADAVVVANVVEVYSRLTQRDEWLESTLEIEIEEVLKNAAKPNELIAGQRLSLRSEGGEISHNGTTIVARPNWARVPEKGKRYLYFLGKTDEGNFGAFPASATFEITPKTIRRLQDKEANFGIDRNGLDPQKAFDIVRSAAALPRLP